MTYAKSLKVGQKFTTPDRETVYTVTKVQVGPVGEGVSVHYLTPSGYAGVYWCRHLSTVKVVE